MLALAVVFLSLLFAAGPASAATDPTGKLVDRGGNQLRFTFTAGDRDVARVEVSLQSGTKVLEPVTPSRSGISCSVAPSPVDNMFGCMASPAIAAGATVHFDFATQTRYSANNDDSFTGCHTPCSSPSDQFGPFALAGPAPAPKYDLAVEGSNRRPRISVDPDEVAQEDEDDPFSHLAVTLFRATVLHSPASPRQRPSARTRLDVTSDLGFTVSARTGQGPGGDECDTPCDVPALAPGATVEYKATTDLHTALAEADEGTTELVSVHLDCRPGDGETSCNNQDVSWLIRFLRSATSRIGKASPSGASGTAAVTERENLGEEKRLARSAPRDRPRRVQVAILRLARGQHGFTEAPDPLNPAKHGKRKCSWVKNRAAKFRKTPIGPKKTCDVPIWLKAKGVKKWKLRLKRRLRPGRYVLYSRATTRAGAVETLFTKGDRNRKSFKVKKKRRR